MSLRTPTTLFSLLTSSRTTAMRTSLTIWILLVSLLVMLRATCTSTTTTIFVSLRRRSPSISLCSASDSYRGAVTCIKTTCPLYNCICGTKDGSIAFVDVYTNALTDTMSGHNCAITCIDIDTSINRFVSGDEEGNFILWDLDKKRYLKKYAISSSSDGV